MRAGSLDNRGSTGSLLSSMAAANDTDHNLNFNSDGIALGIGTGPKYNGNAIRCIAPSGT